MFAPCVRLKESGADPNETLGDAFKMKTWHCSTDGARKEMDSILEKLTHRAVPINAFDLGGDIIKPEHYRAKLAGAIVEARFTLSHQKGKGGIHYFSADIAQLDVVIAPPAVKRPSPLKRKATDFTAVSPKKARLV
ncbi:hypothetical protein B0H12DRAFT_1240566 [Mycena haematopus]|nr:hypothetical protein B0H12DRAFT_1240566 [Mycena haematopus]